MGTMLAKETILAILRLIDSGRYTQKEAAERYGVSASTISNYNRLYRARFRNEKYASIIVQKEMELEELKKKFNIPLEKMQLPNGFKPCSIGLLGNNPNFNSEELREGATICGYFTESRLNAKMFVEDNPQYHFYTIVSDIEDDEQPTYLKTDAYVRKFGFICTKFNLGILQEKDKLKIIDFELETDVL